jgi:hypothetical protein
VIRVTLSLVLAACLAGPPHALAAPATQVIVKTALFRFDALGLDAQRVERLETLFRLELERLYGTRMPGRTEVDRATKDDPALRGCTGEPVCLCAIGKKMGAVQIISGNVGALDQSYIINLKLVDVATQKEIRRVSEPLSGTPDELIEAVRVAAYRLAAPERLLGSLEILSDVSSADISLDGKRVGKTPLTKVLSRLSVGTHQLFIQARGYTDFVSQVEVRFQKTTRVVVRMVQSQDPAGTATGVSTAASAGKTPWYSSTWAYAGAFVGAVVVGALIGQALAEQEVVRCDEQPSACMP